jgi:FecR protein
VSEDCARYSEELAALRRGEPAELPADELAAHLTGCEGCRRREEEAGRLFALLDNFEPEVAPEGAMRLRLAISTGKYVSGNAELAPRRLIPLPVAAFAAAAAFLVALWLGSTLDWGQPAREENRTVAVLTAADGLEVLDDDAESAPRAGDPLKSGTRLRVAKDGHASLVLHRGARVELAGGSVFELRDERGLYVESGRLLAMVRKGGGGFSVRTPLAEVVTLGTRFTVEVRDGATRVTVTEGRVRFTRLESGNGSVEVASRQASTVLAGSAPTTPAPASVGDLAWTGSARRPKLRLDLALKASRIALGKAVTAKLNLTNRGKSALNVDGTGRGRSSYFVSVEDPAGRRSHFSPAVLSARIDGVRTRAPLVRLKPGGSYELEIDLGGFATRPGEYRITAVYLESAATATTDWSGALESAEQVLVVEHASSKGKKVREQILKDVKPFRRLIDGPNPK